MAELSVMDRINAVLSNPENATMSLAQIVSEEIREFKQSEQYQNIVQAESYYRNRSDVQKKTNDVANRSNARIEHPILKKLVDQKANYLLSKPWTVDTANGAYGDALNKVFDATFRRKIKSLGKGAVKSGIQSRAGFFNEIAKIDTAQVESAVSYPWSGAMFSDRLWRNVKQVLPFQIRETITKGIIHGSSVDRMTQELSSAMGKSYKTAERLIRTEMGHIQCDSVLQAYKEAGIKEYEFVAGHNEETCPTCGAMDGRIFKVEKAIPGENYPLLHPNCRCTTIKHDPDDALDWFNSGEPMPKRETYQEWYDRQVAKNGQGSVETERKKSYNIKADSEQFDAYRTVLPTDELPADLESFQNMKYTDPDRYSMTKAKVRLYNSTGTRGTMPNASQAATPEDKFVNYLLNPDHKEGQHKAHVIESVLGYDRTNWSEFSDKIFREVQKSPVSTITTTKHGTKYKVPVIVYGKKGRFLRLNTVWQIDNGSNVPRLVTATFDKKKK